MNNITLSKAEKWMADMGIRTEPHTNCLYVNRDDMCAVADAKDESDSYTEILAALKSDISTKLFWGGKDDNWYYLESF